MPRSLPIRIAVVVILLALVLVALSRIDATKVPHRVVKVIPDNALAH